MVITESFKNGIQILNLTGRFDFKARHEFKTAIEKAGQGGARHITLNLQGVPFIDSAALGMLATMHQKLTAQGIHVTLVNQQNYVKRILELGKMNEYFSIHATEE